MDDLLVTADWRVAEITISAGEWLLPAAAVTLASSHVARMDRARRTLRLNLDRAQIRSRVS